MKAPSALEHRHDHLTHVVQFYSDDQELVSSVGRYLSEGLRRGRTAIVIATAEHQAAFRDELAAAGLTEPRLIALDAAETLAGFMVDGRVDPAAFDATVGALVRDTLRRGGGVCAYGEMVALLWADGNVAGAIELEDVWNGLLAEASFSLYCAYPTAIVGDDAPQAVDEIYRVHSGVTGRPDGGPMLGQGSGSETAQFLCSSRAPRAARRFAAAILEPLGFDEVLYDVMVVVSELSANAVQHARTRFSVVLRHADGVLFVGVRDASPALPVLRQVANGATSGRGLALVDVLADRWGSEVFGAGKIVWAEFSLVHRRSR